MLVALNDEKQFIILHSKISREKLLKMKKLHKFYCPQCKEEIILKVGTVNIPHFAHKQNSNCELFFSEKESVAHLQGKEQLYQFFKEEKGLNVQLEPYIKEIRQRPDLLVSTNNRKYAIEFQCSPIEDEMFRSRNEGYHSIEIIPIWIPLTPQNLNIQKTITKISIPIRFRKFLLHQKQQSFYITYHPHTKQFIYISNLLHVYGNAFLAKIVPLSNTVQQFPFFIPKVISAHEFNEYIMLYNMVKGKYLNMRISFSHKGVNDLFLRSLYELKLSLNDLPLFLGIPLKGNEQLKLFSVEWQTALFYFLKQFMKNIDEINEQDIFRFLKWAKLEVTKGTVDIVRTYCSILKELKVCDISSNVSEEQMNHKLYKQFVAFNL